MTEEFKTTPSPLDEQALGTPEENAPQYVTTEQLQAFGDQLALNVKAQMGRFPSMIDQKLDSLKPTAPLVTEEVGKDDAATAQVRDLLKQERAELAQRQDKIDKTTIRTNLESTLLAQNANPLHVKLVADSLMLRNASSFKINNTDLGESSITLQANEFDEPVLLDSFVKSFMLTAEGQAIVQQKKAPSVNIPSGRGPITGDLLEVTQEEANKMDPKVLMSGRVSIVG